MTTADWDAERAALAEALKAYPNLQSAFSPNGRVVLTRERGLSQFFVDEACEVPQLLDQAARLLDKKWLNPGAVLVAEKGENRFWRGGENVSRQFISGNLEQAVLNVLRAMAAAGKAA